MQTLPTEQGHRVPLLHDREAPRRTTATALNPSRPRNARRRAADHALAALTETRQGLAYTTFFPWLRIASIWLEQAGFEPGQRVRIEVQHGRLITTPD